MGGQRQVRPSKVFQTVTRILNHRPRPNIKVQKPVWYHVIESIPPAETVTRPLPPQHKPPSSGKRKPSRLFQPQQLVYEEDALRRQFYQDHPWELARPRMIIEMDGRDAERHDWSRGLRQPGIPLCGECVVQRQLWMMHNGEGMAQDKAYDIVRREFYALRHAEDVERRIAKEEAMKVGAYFGKSAIQVSLELEDQQYDNWMKWATKRSQTLQAAQDAAYTNFTDVEEDAVPIDMDEAAMEATQPDAASTDNTAARQN